MEKPQTSGSFKRLLEDFDSTLSNGKRYLILQVIAIPSLFPGLILIMLGTLVGGGGGLAVGLVLFAVLVVAMIITYFVLAIKTISSSGNLLHSLQLHSNASKFESSISIGKKFRIAALADLLSPIVGGGIYSAFANEDRPLYWLAALVSTACLVAVIVLAVYYLQLKRCREDINIIRAVKPIKSVVPASTK